MKKKIKILFFSHTIDFAGTWRSHERIFEAINKDVFDPYIFYWPKGQHNRLEILKQKVPSNRLIPFNRTEEQKGHNEGYIPLKTNFAEIAREIGFDVVLFQRSGYYEWPFNERIAPLQIEISVFDASDYSPYLDKSIAVSNRVKRKKQREVDAVVYNPIPLPSSNYDNLISLRNELDIPKNHTILGRIGRPAEFDPIALRAFKMLQPFNATYIIIGSADEAIQYVKSNKIENVMLFGCTNDDYFIEKFFKTIDIFAHYRDGGESFGTGIAQSMMYGKPVVSHYSGFNAQAEIIANGGFVVNDSQNYAQALFNLINNKDLYNLVSKRARQRAMDFEQYHVTRQIENLILKWLINNE